MDAGVISACVMIDNISWFALGGKPVLAGILSSFRGA